MPTRRKKKIVKKKIVNGEQVKKPAPSKLAICINRIDKYLDDEDNKWDNIYNELVNHNESVVDDDKFSEEHRSAAAEYLRELPKIKIFIYLFGQKLNK